MRNGWWCGNLTSSELNVASSDITLSSPLIVISTDSPFITYTPHEAFNLMCNFSFLHWSFQYRLELLSFVSILKHICHCVNLNRKMHRFPLSLRCCVNVCTPVYVFPLTTVTFRSPDIGISRSNWGSWRFSFALDSSQAVCGCHVARQRHQCVNNLHIPSTPDSYNNRKKDWSSISIYKAYTSPFSTSQAYHPGILIVDLI